MPVVTFEMSDQFLHPVFVEVRVQRESVEVVTRERIVGIFDRHKLYEWVTRDLTDEWEPSSLVETSYEVTWLRVPMGAALCIEDRVPAMVLSNEQLEQLRAALAPDTDVDHVGVERAKLRPRGRRARS